ncbi:MAG: phosphoribosyl-AMP cyclohydrolase [Gemmataceae bacterium]
MLDFDKAGGLVPAVAQDAETGDVLMLAWMNREAFDETVRTRRAVYFSRSRTFPSAKARRAATCRK